MFIRLILSLIWIIISGFLLVSLIWKNDREDFSDFGLRLCLGMGAGFGLASLNFFLWQLAFDPKTRTFILGEVGILILLAVIYGWKLQPHKAITELVQWLKPGKPTLLAVIFLILASIALVIHLQGYAIRPQGFWDAWMIWNKHARFLFRDHEFWQGVFSTIQQHPDYPMLLPANVARAWSYMGKESPFASALIGFSFVFGILALLVLVVRTLRGPKGGYLAGIILMSAPAYHVNGTNQSADFPLAFFLLGMLILINLSEQRESNRRHWILAGIFAALATWTKNEGWLIILAIGLTRSLVLLLKHTKRQLWQETTAFFIGAAPVLILVLLYKIVFSPGNDLIGGQGASTFERLTEIARYARTAQEFIWQLIRLDPENSIPFIVLPVFALIFGIIPHIFQKTGTLTNILLPIFIFTGYYLVFITTPHDLEWHLFTANSRLFFQVWPITVLATVLIIKLPEEDILPTDQK